MQATRCAAAPLRLMAAAAASDGGGGGDGHSDGGVRARRRI